MSTNNGLAAEAVESWQAQTKAGKNGSNGTPRKGSSRVSTQQTIDRYSKSTLLSATTWDIFSPPPSNSLKGKVVPRVVNRFKNRRKISVEVHRVTPALDPHNSSKKKESKEKFTYEECVVRVLVPATKQHRLELKKEAFTKLRQEKGSNETFTSVKEIRVTEDDDDDDGSTMNGHEGALADAGGKEFEGWKPKYRIPCRSLTIKQQQKKSVFVLIEIQRLRQERELIFDTLEDAQKFCDKIQQEQLLEEKRAKGRLEAALGDIKLPPMEKITLLVEIVSGWQLPIGDISTSDPYVIVALGREEVHRTKHISSTLDPVWTLKTGSLFLLTVESERLFLEDGLALLIKDYDQFGHNEMLGAVTLPPTFLYNGRGERREFKLQPPPGSKEEEVPGFIAIRCRRATDYDKNFMNGYEESLHAVVSSQNPKTNNSNIKSIVTRHVKNEKDGTRKYKVRPGPDPERPDGTEWLTERQIEAEVMKPSRSWTHAGIGNLGRIYLEILGCDDLPNLDAGGFLGNKTDAFVSIVYEDVAVRTDTIDDCLSPRWLPWSNRAFILNIAHSSSQVFVGVFDFDGGFDDHDLIGRISIDVTNLRRNTEYLLSYNIYPTARVSGRKISGKINVRLRLEIPDERKMALSALEPPPPAYVNVKKRKDFRVIRQTCVGKYDYEKYSTATLKSYVDELREYQHILFYLEDAVMTLLLWRGHFPLKVFGKQFMIPLHSFNAFIVAVILVENPQYFPSFCFLVNAWILIAVMGWRRNSSNVWSRCQSFQEILEKLMLGYSRTPAHNIGVMEGFNEAKAEIEKWMKRVADAEAKAERDYVEAQKLEQERLKELEEIGEADGDISTKVGGGISIDPIKAALHPVQLLLGMVCGALRIVKNIVMWEEAYFSFWITCSCVFLAVICLFVPWFFLIRWTSRLVVWTVFGPWMKLLDVYYFSKLQPETEQERIAREAEEKRQRRLATSEAASKARVVREDAQKMKVMKKYMFGKFAVRVPIIKQDRYADRPLPESSAKPYQPKALTLSEVAMQEAGYKRSRLPGQTLVGDMIPKVEVEAFTAAPVGTAIANPELLARNDPERRKPKTDSTASAYLKILSAVVVAGVLTFFGVPFLAGGTEFVSEKLKMVLQGADEL